MLSQRWRPLFFVFLAVIGIWAVALTAYRIAASSKMTAARVLEYVNSIDLSKLSPEQRKKVLRALADKVNSLTPEERRKARSQRGAWKLMQQMTEEEKEEFVEATLPTGFKQMLTSFEELPADRRRRAIDDTLRELRRERDQASVEGFNPQEATNAPVVSPELEAKVRTIGLKAFYSQSSAQTKAELAPVLEELQHLMESGRPLRRR